MIELAQAGVQRCLVLKVIGERFPRAGRLLAGLLLRRKLVRIELRTDDFDASNDLLNNVWALIGDPVLILLRSRMVVDRRLSLLLLCLGLVHFTLQLLHPLPEALLALFVDTHLQQLFVLL